MNVWAIVARFINAEMGPAWPERDIRGNLVWIDRNRGSAWEERQEQ